MTQNLYSTEDTELAHTEAAYTHPTFPPTTPPPSPYKTKAKTYLSFGRATIDMACLTQRIGFPVNNYAKTM
jgi:hypothetical protein